MQLALLLFDPFLYLSLLSESAVLRPLHDVCLLFYVKPSLSLVLHIVQLLVYLGDDRLLSDKFLLFLQLVVLLFVLLHPHSLRLLRALLCLVDFLLVLLVLVVNRFVIERLLLAGRELLLFDLADAEQVVVQTPLLIFA